MGKILTFYSYKGGTGRSMSLANVAWLLGSADFRVLVIDWDLEAPGLHRYFKPFLVDPDLFETPGLIDGLWEITTDAFTNRSRRERQSLDIDRVDIADFFEDYVCRLDWSFGGRGSIDFIGAGRQVGSYSERVNSFDWKRFYEFGGGRLLDRSKAWFKETYDFVLIDSRTGVSDTSGICTIQMPDTLVTCFTFNHQSIEGAAAILRSVRSQRSSGNGSNIDFFPLAMRIDSAELVKLEQARDWARMVFSPFLPERDRDNPRLYWDGMEVSYWPFYAYEEVLAAFRDRAGPSGADRTLLGDIEKMARRVTGRQELHAPQVPEGDRERILAAYAFTAHLPELETLQDPEHQRPSRPTRRLVTPDSRRADKSTGPSRAFNVFISASRADCEISELIAHELSFLSRSIDVFISDSNPSGSAFPQQTTDIFSKTDLMLMTYTGDSNAYQFYELGVYRGVAERNSRSAKIVVLYGLAEIPTALSQYTTIRISRESIDEASTFFRQLTREIDSIDIGVESVPDWATHLARELSELFDRDVLQDDIRFQHYLSFEINAGDPVPSALQSAKIEAPSATIGLFGLARDRLTWGELLRASPVLEHETNSAWAQELQGMLLRVLQGLSPSAAMMNLTAFEGRLYRAVIYRHSRTRRDIHFFRILLIENPRRMLLTGSITAQTLLFVSRYRYEVLDWGIKQCALGGFVAEADWEELYMRIEAIQSDSIESGIADRLLEKTEISEVLRASLEYDAQLVALARRRGRGGKEDRERLLSTFRGAFSISARLISELALSIGIAAEEAGSL